MNTRLITILIYEEGFKSVPYLCSAKALTIGYGHRIKEGEKFTRIDKGRALLILRSDISDARKDAEKFDWFADLDQCRQDAIIAMVFQLGLPRYLGFKKHIAAMARGDYTSAAAEILDSKLNKQCFNRSVRLARWVNLGQYPEVPRG